MFFPAPGGFFGMKSLETVQIWLVRLLVFLFPLFFLPITSEFFDINKTILLAIGTLVAIALWAASHMHGEFKFRVTPFDLPVLAFAVVYIASALIVTPNKMDAFFAPGMATFVLFATLFYFLIVQQSGGRESLPAGRQGDEGGKLVTALLGGGAIAGLVAAVAGTGVIATVIKSESLPLWITQTTFNTIGGLLPAVTVFVVLGVLTAGRLLAARQGKAAVVNTVLLVFLVAGAATSVYQMLPGRPAEPKLLPVSTGWSVALESLKRQPLLGVGPGNFVEAFNRFRQAEYNNTSVWNLRFSASSNWYLETWTVAGLLGIVAFLWLVWTVWRSAGSIQLTAKQPYYALMASLIAMLLVPVGFVLLFTFYLLLALVASSKASDLALEFSASGGASRNNLIPGFFGLLAIVGLVAVGFWGRPVYAAELAYKSALDAVGRNDGVSAYNSLISAINQNVGVDRYRVTYSQINLALANNVASKQDLTDQDRETVSQLIQQAIREGQAGVALNRNRSGNWENLARIYQAVMPFAQGADQFAIQTYQQAIALDPVNPNLRIALGGVFYALGNYEEAVKVFEVAALAKPDLANAHYNLAVALREKKDTARAAAEMNATLSLVSSGTPDYDKAKKELDELQAKLKEETATPSAQVRPGTAQQAPLQAPQPAPEQVIEPPLELPQEAAPPSTESGEPAGQ